MSLTAKDNTTAKQQDFAESCVTFYRLSHSAFLKKCIRKTTVAVATAVAKFSVEKTVQNAIRKTKMIILKAFP